MRAIDDEPCSDTSLEEVWNRLALATPQPDPFCATTHWQLAFREAIDRRRPTIVRQCDEGLIHFARHRLRKGAALGPIERHWLFGCNLLGPNAIDLLQTLLEELKTADDETPVIVSGLDPEGRTSADLKSRLGGTYKLALFFRETQCAASLHGGLDGFLARRSANSRRNLRRSVKRATDNDVEFHRFSPQMAEEADAVFARMLAVELRSWKGLRRCGMESPSMTRFYSIMLRRLAATSEARVILAVHEDQDIGFIFGGMAGGVYRGQQFSFDDEFAVWSIGNAMQLEQIRWLCEEGATRYDLGPLLGPSMEYKRHWTELQLPIEAWIIRPR